MPRKSKPITLKVNQQLRSNTIEHITETAIYLRCHRCNSPFKLPKRRLRYPPMTCGCGCWLAHEKVMASVFRGVPLSDLDE
jgi:hypothetical protein